MTLSFSASANSRKWAANAERSTVQRTLPATSHLLQRRSGTTSAALLALFIVAAWPARARQEEASLTLVSLVPGDSVLSDPGAVIQARLRYRIHRFDGALQYRIIPEYITPDGSTRHLPGHEQVASAAGSKELIVRLRDIRRIDPVSDTLRLFFILYSETRRAGATPSRLSLASLWVQFVVKEAHHRDSTF